MAQEEERHKPPYIAWSTLKTFLGHLQELPAPPTHIDRTVWSRWVPGGVGPQLMTALRYLALIDDEGAMTSSLSTILRAKDEAEGKRLLRDRIVASYEPVFGAMDLSRATPQQIEDAFERYGATGDVRRKAVAFFLGAAKELEIPLSPLVLERAKATRRGQRKGRRERPAGSPGTLPNGENAISRGGRAGLPDDPLTIMATYMPQIFNPASMSEDVQQAWVKLFTWVKKQTAGEK